jgi:hypothetical protein
MYNEREMKTDTPQARHSFSNVAPESAMNHDSPLVEERSVLLNGGGDHGYTRW